MTHTKTLLYGLVIVMVLALTIALGFRSSDTHASAPSGLPATMASTSLMLVGSGNAITIFATSTTCSARIVTTIAQPIMLTFSDALGASPTGVFGFLQAASTTKEYDSGQYGCGLMKVYGFNASTSITVSETR